ncbi:MAG: prepilin peptidase [Candidatus Nanoarchaeia archaeon]|nr:prepilin peptidase [Candidatus Nanoarchaeia archaeon]
MYELILVASTLICFVIASIMDIKKREIEDYISGFLALFAGFVRTLWFVQTGNIIALSPMIMVAPLTFGVSYLIYKKNLWGGGDVKLISAASVALTGFGTDVYFHYFLVNLLFAGAFYGILYSIALTLKNIKQIGKNKIRMIKISSIASGSVMVLFAWLYVGATQGLLKQSYFFVMLISLIFFGYPFAKTAEEKFFYKKRKVEQLTEGDWIAEDIKKYDRVLIKIKTALEKKHIELLKKMDKKEVMIKEGIPFVPSFLFSLLITLINPYFFTSMLGF